jgi:hypothetical protein
MSHPGTAFPAVEGVSPPVDALAVPIAAPGLAFGALAVLAHPVGAELALILALWLECHVPFRCSQSDGTGRSGGRHWTRHDTRHRRRRARLHRKCKRPVCSCHHHTESAPVMPKSSPRRRTTRRRSGSSEGRCSWQCRLRTQCGQQGRCSPRSRTGCPPRTGISWPWSWQVLTLRPHPPQFWTSERMSIQVRSGDWGSVRQAS